MRILRHVFLLISFTFLAARLYSQSVVVSSYFNAADPRDEWVELLVVADNTDMRNWTIRDNNSSQTAWQTAVTFNNTAFWNNMRAGTIILVWGRPVTSGLVAHPLDANKADGYIEVDASNTTYFNGGAFGSSPSWAGNSLNVAGGAEIIQLRNASGTHIHALGHNSSPGADWTALPSPKLNHNNSASSGDAIYVCPGNIVTDYGTSAPQAGTTWTSKNSTTITFGLPNISGASPVSNTAFWDTLREPDFTSQIVAPSSVIAGNPGSISFSWTGATDPNTADGTTGYFILRNTSNSFTPPADGTTYTTGATLGSATIIAQLSSSSTTTYTDNTVMNGNAYYYRVYAFRYSTDNPNGNSYHRSRGRAYASEFVEIQQIDPLPVELTIFNGQQKNESVELRWTTASEINNDYFAVERSVDGAPFVEIGKVNGNGTSTQLINYQFTDDQPGALNYYRLRQVDFNGQNELSNVIAVAFISSPAFTANCYFSESGLNYNVESDEIIELLLTDITGRVLFHEAGLSPGKGIVWIENLPPGMYCCTVTNGRASVSVKLVK